MVGALGTDRRRLRVCAPLLSRRPPDLDLQEALRHRIHTVEVNLHFTPVLDELELRPGLAQVRCPVLVLAGQHDPLLPVEITHEIITSLPEGLGELQVIPGAAHDVLVDDPLTAHAAIRAFVQQVTLDPRSGHDRAPSPSSTSGPPVH